MHEDEPDHDPQLETLPPVPVLHHDAAGPDHHPQPGVDSGRARPLPRPEGSARRCTHEQTTCSVPKKTATEFAPRVATATLLPLSPASFPSSSPRSLRLSPPLNR